MNRSPSVDPQVIRDIEADALKQQARLHHPQVIRDIEAKEAALRLRARRDAPPVLEAEAPKVRALLDPQVVRDVHAEALEQQAHLAKAHPTPKERHGLRRWLHHA